MKTKPIPKTPVFPKSPTGIHGLDEITGGGLPTGRPTLLCGGTGCGKTMLAMEFLIHGALEYGEPGVFMAFEETAADLTQNVRSLGFDLDALVARKKLALDHVHVERSEFAETGEYDLEGLFIRLGFAIDSIGAKRVVLDTLEALFAGLKDEGIIRAELRRLFRWLKDKGITAIITAERGDGTLTRNGIEEYVSDCVITLDNRVVNQVSTRWMRVMKYRGTEHGSNEYPFLIDRTGVSVWPITSLRLEHEATNERVLTGIPQLDRMLGGGFYRESSVLLSGTAGTGKTSVAASFADATCRRGERCLYFSFEESPSQILRNMRSIGVDLAPWVKKDRLRFHASRPTYHGLELHLARMVQAITEFAPQAVVVDQISSLDVTGHPLEIKSTLIRLIDFLKMRGITALMTNLTAGGSPLEQTDARIASLIDTWMVLRDLESGGERNRGLHILKSRGMAHSNQVREFLLTGAGIKLIDVYVGPSGVLTGSARLAQETRDTAEELVRSQQVKGQETALSRKREAMESQIAALRAEFSAESAEADRIFVQEKLRDSVLLADRVTMGLSRHADVLITDGPQERKPANGRKA